LIVSAALIVLLIAAWIAGPAAGSDPAQSDPTAQQATVEGAVQTLFAQTAAASPDMTQTVAAAFAAAQTATAAAPNIDTSAAPVSVDTLEVASVVELPLLAAPLSTAAYLSPDGRRIAYMMGDVFCLLDIDLVADQFPEQLTQDQALELLSGLPEGASCLSLENAGLRAELETVRWSPDGRYLVMNEDFFRFYVDSDIWVLDTNRMVLSNLTDDGEARLDITAPANQAPPIDVVPRWLPDDRLVFLRYTGQGDDFESPYVFTIQPDGSNLQQIGQLQTPHPFAVSALAVSDQDQLAYNLWINDSAYQNLSGVWISNLDGSEPEQVWHDAERPNQVPFALDWSPDAAYIALYTPATSFAAPFEPESSAWRAVRLSDKQTVLFSPDHFVRSVGWSPDGSTVVYTTQNTIDTSQDGLYIAAAPGALGRRLVQAGPEGERSLPLMSTTPRQAQLIPWTADQVVMVGRGAQAGILIVQLAAP
jgi:Tol biopolymer transport system component